MKKCKTIRMVLVFLIVGCCNISLNVDAKVMVKMHTATGAITTIRAKAITLEGGRLFYPGKNSVSPPLNPGIIVTIRYYETSDGTYYYTEVALGENALSGLPPMGDNFLKKKHLK